MSWQQILFNTYASILNMTNWSNVHVLQIGKYYAAVFYLFTL